MCLRYIHEPWIFIRVFLSESGFFGKDITMDITWILQPGMLGNVRFGYNGIGYVKLGD